MNLEKYIDHTLLSPTAASAEIKDLCEEAIQHRFYAVCVNSSRTKEAKENLVGSEVKLAVTIGFPLGAASTEAKIKEAETAVNDGADEIDMVMNLGFFKDKKFEEVVSEIRDVKQAIGNSVLKVIIETGYLTDAEISKASELVLTAGADFVKTSTGFGSRGANLNDIKLMQAAVGNKLKIKASGGIRDAKTAEEYIKMGVDRIGTSSGIKIIS